MDQWAQLSGEEFSRHEGRILFIVESRNGAERSTLVNRLNSRIASADMTDRCSLIHLPVSDGKSNTQLRKLAEVIESQPDDVDGRQGGFKATARDLRRRREVRARRDDRSVGR